MPRETKIINNSLHNVSLISFRGILMCHPSKNTKDFSEIHLNYSAPPSTKNISFVV